MPIKNQSTEKGFGSAKREKIKIKQAKIRASTGL